MMNKYIANFIAKGIDSSNLMYSEVLYQRLYLILNIIIITNYHNK